MVYPPPYHLNLQVFVDVMMTSRHVMMGLFLHFHFEIDGEGLRIFVFGIMSPINILPLSKFRVNWKRGDEVESGGFCIVCLRSQQVDSPPT